MASALAGIAGIRERRRIVFLARSDCSRRWSSLRSTAAKRGPPRAIVVAPTFLNLRRVAASRSTCKPAGREMRHKALAANRNMEAIFNISIRKFLKTRGVSAQRRSRRRCGRCHGGRLVCSKRNAGFCCHHGKRNLPYGCGDARRENSHQATLPNRSHGGGFGANGQSQSRDRRLLHARA